MVALKLMEQIKSLCRKKVRPDPQTDPLKPDFDVRAWLAKHPADEDEALNPCTPTGTGLKLGFSDHGTSAQYTEQKRKSIEYDRQQEEVKAAPITPQRKAS